MSEITGTSEYQDTDILDGIVSGNGDGNLDHVGGSLTELDFDDLSEIINRNVLGRPNTDNGTNFISSTTTISISMGELLNKIAPVTMIAGEYQRELRDVGAKEIGELHQAVCESGQTDLVAFTLTSIEPLIEGIDEKLDLLRQEGGDENLEDLL